MAQKTEISLFQRLLQAPKDLSAGVTYPLEALLLLVRSPRLLSLVIMPIGVNTVLGVLLYLGVLVPGWQFIAQLSTGLPAGTAAWVATLPPWLSQVLGWIPAGVGFLDDILQGILAIALFIILGLLLVQFGAIVGAPWYSNLAEQVERHRMGQLPASTMSLGRALKDVWRAIAFQGKKLLLLAIAAPFLLLFSVLPLGGLVASTGWLVLAIVLVLLDFIDPPLERRRFSFRTKLGVVGKTFPASVTFGFVCLWLISIPFLNLLTVPLCVVAGTLFCCDYALAGLIRD
ncbi:MAG: EI24 domain-containing protein [Leptolyngbyaceae cyanobacterium]